MEFNKFHSKKRQKKIAKNFSKKKSQESMNINSDLEVKVTKKIARSFLKRKVAVLLSKGRGTIIYKHHADM